MATELPPPKGSWDDSLEAAPPKEPFHHLAEDGGMGSRKFWLALLAMVLIVGAGLLSGKVVALGANLPTVVGGILGALAVYCGANVTTKWAAAGVAKADKQQE